MPDAKYSRDTQRFDFIGLDLNRPVDSVKAGKLPYGKNIRSFVAGRVEPRDGMTRIAQVVAAQSPVHSCRRLNDTANGTFARIVGTGTHVAYGQSTFTDLDSGYSGNPLALVPWKPIASPKSFMYIGDSSRMRKVSALGDLHTVGLPAPDAPPTVVLTSVPAYQDVDLFNADQGSWTAAGTAGGLANISRTPSGAAGTTTTIANILYDAGTTGWASVQLTSMVGVGRGERLRFNTSAETATVQDVFAGKSATTSTTIGSIVYDVGTNGACSIQLLTASDQVEVNSLLQDSSVLENIRVVGKTPGPAGTYSIRAVTVGTFATGDTIVILPSLRVYLVNHHATTETVTGDAVAFQATAGMGTITRTAVLDLSQIVAGVPTQKDDFMSIGLLVDHPELLTEIKVQLDVDAAVNDFAHNYYTRAIRASDLTPAVQNLQPFTTTGATILQRNIIDGGATGNSIGFNTTETSVEAQQQTMTNLYPQNPIAPTTVTSTVISSPTTGLGGTFNQNNPGGRPAPGNELLIDQVTTPSTAPQVQSQQLESGISQWVDVRFRIIDLIRVGTDDSRSLQNVAKIQVLVTCTGTVTLGCSSWMIGGGYGPDTIDATATSYYYRHRARVLSTNVASNWSPATRLSMDPYRQSVTITPAQFPVPAGTTLVAATDIVLDIERFGGQLADWRYLGTTPNTASPSFADVYSDDLVGGNPIMGNVDYQPWPVIGLPVAGTTGIVAGTSVKDSGTSFNLAWAPGTRMIINSQPYTIYRVRSTSLIELVESAGSQSGVAWQINEPTTLAQPLPALWEWDGTFFAVGDPINPGRLYYSNANSETTQPVNYLDMTSPSEPLMNGLQYNIRSYVFSTENFIQLLKTGDPAEPYRHENIPNGKGMFSRWGMTREPAPIIAFLAKDGIYMTTGGSPTSLTDADLYELFPNEGNLGLVVNGIGPPNIVAAQAANLRLAYYDDYMYFDHIDINGQRASLILAFDLGAAIRGQAVGGWLWDLYTPPVVFHYGEEGAGVHSLLLGTTDTSLYQYAGNSDNSVAISMELTTPSRDQGDPRSFKLYGDIMLDSDTQGIKASCTPYLNNNAVALPVFTVQNTSRSQVAIPLGTSWQTAKNISLNIVSSVSTSARPFFFIYEPRWTFESAPISALSWEISPTTFGMENFKHFGLCKLTHVSTMDINMIFTVDGVVQAPIIVTNSGGIYAQTIFRVPVMKGKLYKLRLASADSVTEFRLDPRDSFFEVKDWGVDDKYSQLRVWGDYSLVEG